MTLHTLASGSEGNCLLVQCGGTRLLLDAGISARRIKTALQSLHLTMDDVDAILLTHAHTDHTAGLATLLKHHATPLYATAASAAQLCARCPVPEEQLRLLTPGAAFTVGQIDVRPFPTAHDCPGSVGYRLDGCGGSIGLLTDSGYVTGEAAEALRGTALLVLESNHDVEWLRSGPYPPALKERVLGPNGHLSNDAAAHFAVEMARSGTREIVLAHLSRENNTPARALETVAQALRQTELSVRLSVAPRREISVCYEAEAAVCSE